MSSKVFNRTHLSRINVIFAVDRHIHIYYMYWLSKNSLKIVVGDKSIQDEIGVVSYLKDLGVFWVRLMFVTRLGHNKNPRLIIVVTESISSTVFVP